jgi:dolichyl-diphosphooligosaccharide--protein glycosyltransferase
MQVAFVGFKPLQTAEHFAAAAVFIALQFHNFMVWSRTMLGKNAYKQFVMLVIVGVMVMFVLAWMSGVVKPFTGRFYTLLTGGKAEIPIIASVSEHQPTPWSMLFFDLNIALALAPAGLFICFRDITDSSLFVILYAITSCYFAGIMVRLVLVFAPVACILSGIALSEAFQNFSDQLKFAIHPPPSTTEKETTAARSNVTAAEWSSSAPFVSRLIDCIVSVSVLVGLLLCCVLYVSSSIWVTAEAYSSPSIVLSTGSNDGSRHIIDDFREAYRWLGQNTPESSRIMAWWDYGYQMNAMANRTTIADNNTWNNTHIATVGLTLSSTEEEAYKVMRKLDVDYMLIIFGGRIGYSSDDINKFLWPVRISAGVYPERIQEKNYYAQDGSYRVDKYAPKTMINSLMYKMAYYRFAEISSMYGQPTGFDRSRNMEIGKKNIRLSRIEEAFTSENWLVRIYKVKPESNRVGGP